MPMFYTPKPRQFHYEPRFYDPEKEKWEAMKKKYEQRETTTESASESKGEGNEDLEYFEQRVREIEEDEKREHRKLGFADLFKRREMPKFNYQPRFQGGDITTATESSKEGKEACESEKIMDKYAENGGANRTRKIKIRRRFDMGDSDYMKPVSGGKIMLYALLACLLLYLILF